MVVAWRGLKGEEEKGGAREKRFVPDSQIAGTECKNAQMFPTHHEQAIAFTTTYAASLRIPRRQGNLTLLFFKSIPDQRHCDIEIHLLISSLSSFFSHLVKPVHFHLSLFFSPLSSL